ncbi:MAG: hypothetical protein J5766_03905, partial [Clostridia bacterium]|nr:hypothetical protein [Clostridia bacterium]
MLCDKCQKNQAVAHIKTVINGIVYEKHLCEECAEQEQINSAFSNPFSHLLDSFFENNTPICGANTKKCPNCNLTFDDILDSGKIGCSECYKTFE